MNLPLLSTSSILVRRRLHIHGVVQGVGFRPYVWRLANELGLAGEVFNDHVGVNLVVEGVLSDVDRFIFRLPIEAPSQANIKDIQIEDEPVQVPMDGFSISDSEVGHNATMIGNDTGLCGDCLSELFNPNDRRWRHAFISCTQCGPRYTLTRSLPYDRPQTSMANFAMCRDCGAEYQTSIDRRFHSVPNACPSCGPKLWLSDMAGEIIASQAPITSSMNMVKAGNILAVKGLGGFHLVCNAENKQAVQRLRAAKQREAKPFAIMVANLASLDGWVEMNDEERALLTSPERPIVLLRKKPIVDERMPDIAPGLGWVGVMLPSTPIHWLLFHEAAGQPAGTAWIEEAQTLKLVMTSANPNGEPLVIENQEALERLGDSADAVLTHNRDIVLRCDDSVTRVVENGKPQFVRRARGYVANPIPLREKNVSVLALGAHFKNTVCLTRGDEAFVSQYIGSLDNPATCEMLMEVVGHLINLLDVTPELIVHDMHPDFFSTRHAHALAEQLNVPTLAVQHHHAHLAAVAAEHHVKAPYLGLALDGVGYGSDGGIWGGELLKVNADGFAHLGHLRLLPLPGGDKAAQEPWRMAASVLHVLGRGDEIATRFANQPAAANLSQLLALQTHCPMSSSMGRWFDAAAGLLGVSEVMQFEGQAAMLLEGLAERYGEVEAMKNGYQLHADGTLDFMPLMAQLVYMPAEHGAALFHATLALGLAEWVRQQAKAQTIKTILLGGGCFLNRVLASKLVALLTESSYQVYQSQQLPPNDSGISLGQAWVGLQHLKIKGS